MTMVMTKLMGTTVLTVFRGKKGAGSSVECHVHLIRPLASREDVGDLIGKDAPEKIYAARVNFKQSSRTMIDDDIMHHLTGTNKFRMQQCMKL
eukprot:9467279-Pyramimonas_sp.AAC.1